MSFHRMRRGFVQRTNQQRKRQKRVAVYYTYSINLPIVLLGSNSLSEYLHKQAILDQVCIVKTISDQVENITQSEKPGFAILLRSIEQLHIERVYTFTNCMEKNSIEQLSRLSVQVIQYNYPEFDQEKFRKSFRRLMERLMKKINPDGDIH